MTEFFFIRHGETDWNKKGLMQGHTDIPLNDTGLAQAEKAAQTLKNHDIKHLICSPLQRCLQTAEAAKKIFNLSLTLDDRLIERSFGDFEGMDRMSIPRDEHGHIQGEVESVEPFAGVIKRAKDTIEHYTNLHKGERILFISHGGVGAALHVALCDQKIMLANAVPYHFTCENGLWQSRQID
ncbi:MAG: histidine phosphatase family protein [Pseudomonadota bacterium]